MNHPPEVQVDDFGVWCLELDYSVVSHGGSLSAVVGHNGPGHASGWGTSLAQYLDRLLRCTSLSFRPIFIGFDTKSWSRKWSRFWAPPVDAFYSREQKLAVGLATLREVCGARALVLADYLAQNEYRWPSPIELAGKIVFYEPNLRSEDGQALGMRGTWANRQVSPKDVARAVDEGQPFHRRASKSHEGFRALRLDQYQADWTFSYGVPPNPIVVDPRAPTSTLVTDAEGKRWRSGSERSHYERVGEQGTFRFPYRTLAAAVERAEGITPLTLGKPDPRRAGHGWTVLIRDEASSIEVESTVNLEIVRG